MAKKSDKEQQPEPSQDATPEISDNFSKPPVTVPTENEQWWRGDGGSGEVQ